MRGRPGETWLTLEEAAELRRVGKRTVEHHVTAGRLGSPGGSDHACAVFPPVRSIGTSTQLRHPTTAAVRNLYARNL